MTTITESTTAELLQHASTLARATVLDFDAVQSVAGGQLPYLSVEEATTVMLDLIHAISLAELHATPSPAQLELWRRSRPTQGPAAWGRERAERLRLAARGTAYAAALADLRAATAA